MDRTVLEGSGSRGGDAPDILRVEVSVRDALILRTWGAGVHYVPWYDQRQWIVVDKINGRVTRWRTERQAEAIWREEANER